MTDIDSKACYDCRNGSCPEHGTTRNSPDTQGQGGIGGFVVDHGSLRSFPAPRCRFCGLPDNLERSNYGWVHEACLTADDSAPPDYEALGYPETSYGINREVDAIAAVTVLPISSWLRSFMEPDENYRKDILGDTDIVDSADKDSYK